VFLAEAGGLPAAQFLMKPPGLNCLIYSRVEQRKGDIAQRRDADDKKEPPAPMDPWIISHWERHPPPNSDLHEVARSSARVEHS